MLDYLRYYHLESYLSDDVRLRFHATGALSTFDFFSIVVWKANRAKSKTAHRILRIAGVCDLNEAIGKMTKALFEATTPRERFRVMLEDWGFLLPMATAVLTVLWPDDFTVYDVRVCAQLGGFQPLATETSVARLWPEYDRFRKTVLSTAPDGMSLRDADRYLWAKASAEQLCQDIASGFRKKGVGD